MRVRTGYRRITRRFRTRRLGEALNGVALAFLAVLVVPTLTADEVRR